MQGTGKPPLSKDEKMELSELREEYKKLKALKKKGGGVSSDSEQEDSKASDVKVENASSSDSEGEVLDDVNDNLSPVKHQTQIKMAQRARTSVSAEVFGKYNIKAVYVPKVIAKNSDVKAKIARILRGAFMFMSLDEKDLTVVIDAMAERKVSAGEVVIKEGDPGDELYIVESGHLTVTKLIDGAPKPVFAYDADGDQETSHVFGELALLYNAPRAATITADKDSSLWALDR